MKRKYVQYVKHIHYADKGVYALYYRKNCTLYINLDFKGRCKLYILK